LNREVSSNSNIKVTMANAKREVLRTETCQIVTVREIGFPELIHEISTREEVASKGPISDVKNGETPRKSSEVSEEGETSEKSSGESEESRGRASKKSTEESDDRKSDATKLLYELGTRTRQEQQGQVDRRIRVTEGKGPSDRSPIASERSSDPVSEKSKATSKSGSDSEHSRHSEHSPSSKKTEVTEGSEFASKGSGALSKVASESYPVSERSKATSKSRSDAEHSSQGHDKEAASRGSPSRKMTEVTEGSEFASKGSGALSKVLKSGSDAGESRSRSPRQASGEITPDETTFTKGSPVHSQGYYEIESSIDEASLIPVYSNYGTLLDKGAPEWLKRTVEQKSSQDQDTGNRIWKGVDKDLLLGQQAKTPSNFHEHICSYPNCNLIVLIGEKPEKGQHLEWEMDLDGIVKVKGSENESPIDRAKKRSATIYDLDQRDETMDEKEDEGKCCPCCTIS
jgi:hypothetical protein